MAFSPWSENDPAGSDAASSINEAATRAAIRIRERMATTHPDWSTATDRIHQEKLFINTNGLTIRDDTDAATLGSINSAGYFNLNTQPRCRLRKASTQTLTQSIYNSVIFDTEDFDVGGLHDNVTNNTRVTIPANGGGIYIFAFHTVMGMPSGPAASYPVTCRIRKNGTTDEVAFPTIQHEVTSPVDMTIWHPITYVVLINAAAADYYEMQINPAFSQSISPHLSFAKLF